MNISSNYYNYYKTSNSSSISAFSKARLSATSTASAESTSSSTSTQKRSSTASDPWSLLTLSFSGMMLQNSLQQPSTGESDISELMEKIKSDIDGIKAADIEAMSSTEVKETLTNLQNDLKAVSDTPKQAEVVLNADLETMSEADMRTLLTQVQTDVQKGPEGRPPKGHRPPMMGGMSGMGGIDLSQLISSLSSSDETASTSDATDEDTLSALQEIIQKLTEGYDSATDSSEDYATTLKTNLTNLFDQQKNSIDALSTKLFNQIDFWKSLNATETN